MPYCPKCDMEFIDGITKCTDCGGPLAESKEAADAIKQKEQANMEALRQKEFKTISEAFLEPGAESPKKADRLFGPSGVYVEKAEKRQTEDIIAWFLSAYSPHAIDAKIQEFEELSEEERSLKRFQIIQDNLITEKDLPDPSYVDALSEEIYAKLYESTT